MVDIKDIRMNSYSYSGIDPWEEYFDDILKDVSERGFCLVRIDKDYNNKSLKDLSDRELANLLTCISMYKDQGFRIKIKIGEKKDKKETYVKHVKIYW